MLSATALLKRLRKGEITGPLKVRDIYIRGWAHLTDAESTRAAVDLLEAKNWLMGERVEAGDHGGRPTFVYHVNPAVHS